MVIKVTKQGSLLSMTSRGSQSSSSRSNLFRLMTMTQRLCPADQMERLAGDLHSLAFDMREPSRSIGRVERLIAEGERISTEVRAVVRGRS